MRSILLWAQNSKIERQKQNKTTKTNQPNYFPVLMLNIDPQKNKNKQKTPETQETDFSSTLEGSDLFLSYKNHSIYKSQCGILH